jgi:hypothetical protein
MKLEPDTEVYMSSATNRKANQQTVVHLTRDCPYLQRAVDIQGPKEYRVLRDGWELCAHCDPDTKIGGDRDRRMSDAAKKIASEDFTPDDVDMLSDTGERNA